MGTRSTVAVCLKADLYASEGFAPHKGWMDRDSSSILCHPEGVMYVFEDVKWYTSDPEIATLYSWLGDDAGPVAEDFLIVAACYDYPESDEDNMGDWHDNPWGVYKAVSVSLEYDEDESEEISTPACPEPEGS